MFAKFNPTQKMRLGVLAFIIGKDDSHEEAFYRMTSGRACKQAGVWKEARGFGRDGLLPVETLLDQAGTCIVNAGQADRQST